MKKQTLKCPVCGSAVVTHYENQFECDDCGRQWTQADYSTGNQDSEIKKTK